MAKTESVVIKFKFKMSLWDCIKLRISGLHKGFESIESVGEIQKVNFRDK